MVVTLDKVCKDVRISLLLVCCYCFFEGGGSFHMVLCVCCLGGTVLYVCIKYHI